MDNFQLFAYLLLGTLVLGLVAFVITYMIGSNWRESVVGRYMMYFMATIAMTFTYILISPVIRDVWGRRYVDLGILILLNFVAWRLTWLLRKIQKGKYYDRKIERNTEEDIS